jgi:hypothetical protein
LKPRGGKSADEGLAETIATLKDAVLTEPATAMWWD